MHKPEMFCEYQRCKKIQAIVKGKLCIELTPLVVEESVISSENVTGFKEWMDR
ncbi:MAG: hypothetical protein ABIS69_11610 [Sediminibacterium sp.]